MRAALDEHYEDHPDDRPSLAEVALHLAHARSLEVASREDLPDALHRMQAAMDGVDDAETLLAATAAHLSLLAA